MTNKQRKQCWDFYEQGRFDSIMDLLQELSPITIKSVLKGLEKVNNKRNKSCKVK
jgi:hypothetical protein